MASTVGPYTLASLAERFGLELVGDGGHEVSRVATLADASPDCVTFLANPGLRPQLAATHAGAVILRQADAGDCPGNCLLSEDPYLSYARLAVLFDRRPVQAPGVHPRASVDPGARLGENVGVAAGAVIGAGCDIGDGCAIGPGCVLAPGCTLGPGCRLVANVTLGDGVRLGRRVLVHPGAVIGADGFGLVQADGHWEKVPQLGSVVVGDDCEIGANTCIDRGAIGDTVLEEDVRIDNLCQIGHNCRIGAHTAMAAFTGISGSVTIGRGCQFAGRSGVHGHLEIAEGVTVAAMTMVKKSITEPGTTWSAGIPARPIREWQRVVGHMNRLDATSRRIRAIERQLTEPNDDE